MSKKFMHMVGQNHGDKYRFEYEEEEVATDRFMHEAVICLNQKKKSDLEEHKRNIEQKLKQMDISLPQLQKLINEYLIIKKNWGRVNYFTGKNYSFLTQDIFGFYCKQYLPQGVQEKICSTKIFKSLYQYIMYDYVLDKERSIEDNYFISFQNCVVDTETLLTYTHDSKIETAYTINANYLEEWYEEDMYYFNQLVNSMTNYDNESIQLIWEMLGYVMLHIPPKRAFFWLGTEPASGKSLLGAFIQMLFGIENCSQIEADDIGKRFSMSQLVTKSVNLGMESSGKLSRSDVVRIKEITGNRVISIEQKGIDRIDFPNYAVLIFASNEPIDIGDADPTDAFWDRCKLIPCLRSCPIEERDSRLLEKIWEERDFIVSKAVDVAKRLIQDDFQFTEPELSKRMKSEWRKKGNTAMGDFIHECIDIFPEEYLYFTPTDELYKRYIEYTGKYLSKNSFSSQFNKLTAGRTIKSKRRVVGYNSPVHGFCNVRIRATEDDDSE